MKLILGLVMPKPIVRTPTGITGFDEILGGGFPQGRVLLVVGPSVLGELVQSGLFLIRAGLPKEWVELLTLEATLILGSHHLEAGQNLGPAYRLHTLAALLRGGVLSLGQTLKIKAGI